MAGRKRTILFIGATVIEVILARLFGLDMTTSVSLVVISNLIVVQFADMVYKGKIFKGG